MTEELHKKTMEHSYEFDTKSVTSTDSGIVTDDSKSEVFVDAGKVSGNLLSQAREYEIPASEDVESDSNVVIDSQTSNLLKSITPEIIDDLEKDLDFYEKVSLVFLLYSSEDLAFQRLQALHMSLKSGSLSHVGLLSDWARNMQSDDPVWQFKFLESLCLIQNFKLISDLHVNDEKLTSRLSSMNCRSFFINNMRKALYAVCENLEEYQVDSLVQFVQQDLTSEGKRLEKFENLYLEMNMLQWLSHKYIVAGKGGLRKLISHLEKMGFEELAENLSEAENDCDQMEVIAEHFGKVQKNIFLGVPSSKMKSESVCSFGSQPMSRSHSVASKISDDQSVHGDVTDDTYPINPNAVGLCVIINQKNFYRDTRPGLARYLPEDELEDRLGTDVDRDALSETFLMFGLKIKLWENLPHDKILELIHVLRTKEIKDDYSCFVFCILSHGEKGSVYGSNSIPVSLDEIVQSFCGKQCPALIKKPKIFIVQACQGRAQLGVVEHSDIAADGKLTSSPDISDYAIFLSTVPGYVSYRDLLKGSWFIQILCEILQTKSQGSHIMDVFTKVVAHISEQRTRLGNEERSMIPEQRSTLRKKLFLPLHPLGMSYAITLRTERLLFSNLTNEFLQCKLERQSKK